MFDCLGSASNGDKFRVEDDSKNPIATGNADIGFGSFRRNLQSR